MPLIALKKQVLMQNNITLLSLLAVPFVLSGTATAGQEAMAPSAPSSMGSSAPASDFGGYIGLSAATGEVTVFSENDLYFADRAHLAGVRVDGGFLFGNGFSIDGRSTSKMMETRSLASYAHFLTTSANLLPASRHSSARD